MLIVIDMVIIILFFIYGLAFGSFANVVIYRTRKEEGVVFEKSYCPKCNHEIKIKDNIPVIGYLLLKGKCRNCKARISAQYPLVELLVGVLCGSVGYFYTLGSINNLLSAVLIAMAFACLTVVFVYDLKYMEIPMNTMWFAIILIFGNNLLIDTYSGGLSNDFFHSVTFFNALSALVAFCFFFGLSYVSDETWMGYGDAFIAIAIGLLLGGIGTFVSLMISFCVGSLVGISLIVWKGKTMKTAIPFGPFLLFGLMVVFFVQNMWPDFF